MGGAVGVLGSTVGQAGDGIGAVLESESIDHAEGLGTGVNITERWALEIAGDINVPAVVYCAGVARAYQRNGVRGGVGGGVVARTRHIVVIIGRVERDLVVARLETQNRRT